MNYVNKLVALVKAHWPAIVAFGIVFWEHYGTTLRGVWQREVAGHPDLSLLGNMVVFAVMYYVKSPRQPAPPTPPTP